jgi:transposase
MVIDGAPSPRSGQFIVPENMVLVRFLPYSPELNPVEHLWDELREKDIEDRVFDTFGAAIAQFV